MCRPETDSIKRRRLLLSDVIVLVAAAAIMFSADHAVHWIWWSFSAWFADIPSWNS